MPRKTTRQQTAPPTGIRRSITATAPPDQGYTDFIKLDLQNRKHITPDMDGIIWEWLRQEATRRGYRGSRSQLLMQLARTEMVRLQELRAANLD